MTIKHKKSKASPTTLGSANIQLNNTPNVRKSVKTCMISLNDVKSTNPMTPGTRNLVSFPGDDLKGNSQQTPQNRFSTNASKQMSSQ